MPTIPWYQRLQVPTSPGILGAIIVGALLLVIFFFHPFGIGGGSTPTLNPPGTEAGKAATTTVTPTRTPEKAKAETGTPTITPMPTEALPTASPQPAATQTPSAPQPGGGPNPSGGELHIGAYKFPSGSQMFHSNKWVSGSPDESDPYLVVYDPSQSGTAGIDPLGWWYQPFLPPPDQRVAHDVAIILRPGRYLFNQAVAQAWLNYDGTHGWEQGKKLQRNSDGSYTVDPTVGHDESWVAVKSDGGKAGGFSFTLLPTEAKK